MRRIPAFLAAAALGLSGCGGGHHHASTTSTSASSTATATSSAQSATQPAAPPGQRSYPTPYGPSPHAPGFGSPTQNGMTPRATGVLTGVPTVPMFDTITLSSMPSSVRVAAGYTAGHWPTYLPLVHAFPHAKVLSIAIADVFHARCLDVEPGDAVPSQAAAWIRADQAAGFAKPCVYSSLWEFRNQVMPLIAAAGIPRSAYWGWDADYTFIPHIDLGFDATQFTDHAFGRNLDESIDTYAFAGLSVRKPRGRTVCFGANAQHSAACRKIQATVASDGRAAASSQRAFIGRGCVVLARRDLYFTGQLKAHPRTRLAYRKGALTATRRAERQRSCPVFRQRAVYFEGRAATITKQYS